ncbi:hypothetical protein TrVE_jg7251 [Triparma verrucosa]|uniref:Uncharacterized protein n=1 Tax=Triparma verrucosa TaxID=1606542 RepID=A0A9W7C429_9STRA|nr:hypothetical protein TrVE_jg7251 [Triparma verrucosa]
MVRNDDEAAAPPQKKAKLSVATVKHSNSSNSGGDQTRVGGGLAAFGFSSSKFAPPQQRKASIAETVKSTLVPTSAASTTASTTDGTTDNTNSGGVSFLPTLRPGELMYSTKSESARKRNWVRHNPNKSRDVRRSYCSTDGSSTGWHAAVFVGANSSEARVRAMWKDHQGSNNVGAEAFGFALGVSTLPADCADCVFLADFLNALAWDVGGAKYKHPAIVQAFDLVKATRKANGFKANGFGSKSNCAWSHCHHPGHKTDDSFFTMLNQVADNMASCQVEVDMTVSLEVLKKLTVQGKGAVDKCKLVIQEQLESE